MDSVTGVHKGLRELALFAGAGGGILGGKLLGWRTVCAVEIDAFCREVLLRRQMDGCLPKFPIWDEIRTFDGKPWRGKIDVISGGFPCQDISCAGSGKGLNGERSGLWHEMSRIIGEVRPRFALVENSPVLTSRGLDRVCGDLAGMGYGSIWGTFYASEVGAKHFRKRIFILADNNQARLSQLVRQEKKYKSRTGPNMFFVSGEWGTGNPSSAIIRRGVSGVPFRVDRIKSIGNSQVPAVVRLAWEILSGK